MSLKEAKEHCEMVAVAEEQYQNQGGVTSRTQKHCECAAEHRQLAEWLNELEAIHGIADAYHRDRAEWGAEESIASFYGILAIIKRLDG